MSLERGESRIALMETSFSVPIRINFWFARAEERDFFSLSSLDQMKSSSFFCRWRSFSPFSRRSTLACQSSVTALVKDCKMSRLRMRSCAIFFPLYVNFLSTSPFNFCVDVRIGYAVSRSNLTSTWLLIDRSMHECNINASITNIVCSSQLILMVSFFQCEAISTLILSGARGIGCRSALCTTRRWASGCSATEHLVSTRGEPIGTITSAIQHARVL